MSKDVVDSWVENEHAFADVLEILLIVRRQILQSADRLDEACPVADRLLGDLLPVEQDLLRPLDRIDLAPLLKALATAVVHQQEFVFGNPAQLKDFPCAAQAVKIGIVPGRSPLHQELSDVRT